MINTIVLFGGKVAWAKYFHSNQKFNLRQYYVFKGWRKDGI